MVEYISFQPKDFFNSVLYTGNGSTQSITGVGFQPDFIWIKCRNDTRNHQLQDSVRNDFDNIINSDSDGAQGTFTDGVTAVGSDGFSVGARAALNTNADTLVSWNSKYKFKFICFMELENGNDFRINRWNHNTFWLFY